jgi:5-formyltetrahydrofolate cyclo-ligase
MKTTESTDEVRAAKQALRQSVLARRATLSATTTAGWSAAIADRVLNLPELQDPSFCFCYIGMPGEVETRALIDALVAAGHALAVPWQPDRTTMQACVFPGWQQMRPAAMGIPVPVNPTVCPDAISIALTPGLAFSPAGGRLGYGAGYYDRWFARHPRARRIALAFDCMLSAEVPLEAHDQPMQVIVTESQIIRI